MHELKKNKKSFDSQVKIYKSLRRLLLVKPFADVTVADIKADCGISRSTFYRNYNNMVDVLDAMFEYFYNRYLVERKKQPQDKERQLNYFFEYWVNHRDLIHIISTENEGIIKECIKRHENPDESDNPYLIDIRYSLLTSLLSTWSESKKETPIEMAEMTRKILNKNGIDLLLDLY